MCGVNVIGFVHYNRFRLQFTTIQVRDTSVLSVYICIMMRSVHFLSRVIKLNSVRGTVTTLLRILLLNFLSRTKLVSVCLKPKPV